jgi:1,4-alpha-glucan branching enzyme
VDADVANAPSAEQISALLSGQHQDPHSILGSHSDGEAMVVRALRPGVEAVDVVLADGRGFPLVRVHPGGLFSGRLPRGSYRLVVHRGDRSETIEDGYRWPSILSERDLELLGEGRHHRLWDVLGAHRRRIDGVDGVYFAVWAPNAGGVRLRGDFDGWDGRAHPLRLAGSGVWEVFVPGIPDGSRYRFAVLGPDGRWQEKADPMAFAAECPPANASVVFTSHHHWRDDDWLRRRARADWASEPMSVYEVHLGSWLDGRPDYRVLAHRLAEYVRKMGFTHVQLLPVTEHPFAGSWGYQVTSYYAPTARFGSPDDFRYLVDHLHRAEIGVLLDFVPAHFPRDDWALGRFDGTPLYEHPDPRRGEHPDWNTYVFDFGRNEVRDFLVSSALYWLDEFHVDGLRVDAVSSMLYLDYSRPPGGWLPNVHGGRENLDAIELLRELTGAVHRSHPGALVIAEESTAWPGVTEPDGLGFDLKWNMGWMHDTLDYLEQDPVFRAGRHDQITFSYIYAWTERFLLPLSHDEVVHGKGSLWQRMPGDAELKAAGVRALLAYQWAHPGKQLLFMGGEFGQPSEWDADGFLPWDLADQQPHRSIHHLVTLLNQLYRALPALHTRDHSPDGFEWISATDADSNVLAFLRIGDDGSALACVANFSGITHRAYRIGLPAPGEWSMVLNTNGDRKAVVAHPSPLHGRPASAEIDLAECGVIWLTQDSSNLSK